MAGRVLAVANMKGGVGKTTLSMMIAESLCFLRRKKVLIIDLDSQGSLSFALSGDERVETAIARDKTVPAFFRYRIKGRSELTDFITERASQVSECGSLDLIVSEPELQFVEREVIADLTRMPSLIRRAPETVISAWLDKAFSTLRADYDWIILDCPPGISAFAFAGIRISDELLIPVTPDFLSLQALRAMRGRILPQADKAGRIVKRVIVNKFRAQASSHTRYRRRFIEEVGHADWTADLVDLQITLKDQLARATEPDEETRSWNTFRQKYDAVECEALVDIFEPLRR